MVITSAINIDMQYKYVNTYVDAVQYDVNSRNVEITLLKAGSRADIPTGSTFEVKFKRPDGSSGSYSELSNGQAAVTRKEINVIVVWLSEFILSEAGETIVSVCIKNGETEVNTFSFIVNVQESPNIGTGLARMYPNTYDATATPSDIAIGKTAYVKGEKILGTFSQVGGGSGTITPPTLGDPEYLIVNGYMGLPEAKKALARRNIDAVASVNGRTPDENGNVNLTTLIPPNVNAGGSGQHLVLVVDMRGGTPVWDQEYTFDQIYNAAEAGTLECYVGMNTDGNPSGDIDSWREATLDVIVSADASYGAKVVFNDTFRGYQYVWNSSGFTYYTIEAGGNGDLTGYATEEWVQDSFQPKGDYALRSELPTVPTKVSAFTNDAGYLTQHQDISGKLDVAALPTAINTALAQAKASGDFDGEDGRTAYEYAQDGGYAGTEEEFSTLLASGVTGNKWAGKIASFLGDSITRGMNTDKTYHEYLKELVGFSACNAYGISGSTVSNYYESMCNRVSDIDAQSDIVFAFGGTNDFNLSIPMGEWYTLGGTTRTVNYDKTTFRGALTTLCNALLNRFPNKRIVLLTPLHRYTYPDDYTELQANAEGLYLEDYVNAVKEAGKIYSIPVIDLYGESGLCPMNAANAAIYFHANDKLHPNAAGHRVIADVIMGYLDRTYPMYSVPVNYTNLVPSAEERIISGDALTAYDGVGYANNYRLSSSGVIKKQDMAIVTGFIPVSGGDTIRIGGIQWCATGVSFNYVCAYKSDYSFIGAVYGSETGYYGTKIHTSCTIDYDAPLTTIELTNNTDIAFIRISCFNQKTQDGSKLIVTKNEKIT